MLNTIILILILVGYFYYPTLKAYVVKKIMGEVVTPKGIITGVVGTII